MNQIKVSMLSLIALAAIGGAANATAFSVSTGYVNSCAIVSSGMSGDVGGKLLCWGDNSAGQIGDGTTTNRATATQVSGMTDHVIRVAVGTDDLTVCAVKQDHDGVSSPPTYTEHVYCWGENAYGNLGDGTTTARHVPTLVVAGTGGLTYDHSHSWGSLTASGRHTCVIESQADGAAYCWGDNTYGELGINSTTITQSLTPVKVTNVHANYYVQIVAARASTCAIKSSAAYSGTSDLYCWGINDGYQLGIGAVGTQYQEPSTPTMAYHHIVGYQPLSVSLARYHGCVIIGSDLNFDRDIQGNQAYNNEAFCWGTNTTGELGDNSHITRTTPIQVHNPSTGGTLNPWQIVTGGSHTCLVSKYWRYLLSVNPPPYGTYAWQGLNAVYCFGDNSYGALSLNDTACSPCTKDTATLVPGSAGYYTSDGFTINEVPFSGLSAGWLTTYTLWSGDTREPFGTGDNTYNELAQNPYVSQQRYFSPTSNSVGWP